MTKEKIDFWLIIGLGLMIFAVMTFLVALLNVSYSTVNLTILQCSMGMASSICGTLMVMLAKKK
ncbi:MAG: hypothetical protein ACFFBD_08695 [Candidatus Hodarchaeota archaeon]